MTAFLLTWKQTGWPHENIVRMVHTIDEHGYVDEPWRIAAHQMAKVGDRVWVLRQGRGPKGIFGAGHITDGTGNLTIEGTNTDIGIQPAASATATGTRSRIPGPRATGASCTSTARRRTRSTSPT